MGYKVTFDNGVSVTFQNQPSSDDLEEAFASTVSSTKKSPHDLLGMDPFRDTSLANKGMEDKTKQIEEGGFFATQGENFSNPLKTVAGMAEQIPAAAQFFGSMLGGAAGAAGAGAASLVHGGDPIEALRGGFQEGSQKVTETTSVLTPETDAGQSMAAGIGHLAEKFKQGVSNQIDQPTQPFLPKFGAPGSSGARRPTNEIDRVLAAIATAAPELVGVASMRGGKGKAETPAPKKPPGAAKDLIDAKAKSSDVPSTAQDQALLERLKGIDDMLNKTEGAEKGFQRKLRAEETPIIRGEEPIYVDPQEQAFRGDPNDPNARLGLEREGEAFDNAATYNQWGEKPIGEPLPLLTRESIHAGNEGPQASMLDVMNNQMKDVAGEIETNKHPMLRRAEERVTKAEELLIKTSEQYQEGRVTAKQLARVQRDLTNLEEALSRTRENVKQGLLRNATPESNPFRGNPFRGPGGKQAGAVDIGGFDSEVLGLETWLKKQLILFKRDEKIVDWFGDSHDLQDIKTVPSPYTSGDKIPVVFVKVNGKWHSQGFPDLERLQDQLVSFYEEPSNNKMVRPSVGPGGRQRGAVDIKAITEELKKALRADVASHTAALARGEALSPDMKPIDPNRKSIDPIKLDEYNRRIYGEEWGDPTIQSPGNKQLGGIKLNPNEGPQAETLNKLPWVKDRLGVMEPMMAEPKDVIEMAKGGKDIDRNVLEKAIDVWTKGGRMFADKVQNPVVRFAMDTMIEYDRLARAKVMDVVHDKYTTAARALNDQQKIDIWNVLNYGDLKKVALSPDELRQSGFSEPEIAFYETHRSAMKDAFASVNEALAAAGKEPINERVAYAAMRSTGDFRRLVMDGEGSVVGVLGSDFRYRLNTLKKKAEALGYTVGPEKYSGGVPRQKGSTQMAMMEALQALAKDDPRVADFLQKADEIYANDAYSYLNSKKHTMPKKGVWGMEGRKGPDNAPIKWQDDVANARDGIRSQAMFLESMLKWGELSKGAAKVREVLKSEEIDMPKAKEWSEDFMRIALGFNPSEIGRSIENIFAQAFKNTGVGYSNYRATVSAAKKVTNTLLLALDHVFLGLQMVQPNRAMPGIKAQIESRGVTGTGFDPTGAAYLAKAAMMDFQNRKNPQGLAPWQKGAFEYARKNHVYGSDLVEHSNRTSKDATYALDKVGNFVLGAAESATRQTFFLAMVNMLYDGGMRPKDGLYQTAHNYTDSGMNSYATIDRPQAYNVAGSVGDLSANLMSYKHGEVSRTMFFARELARHKSARPLLTELAASVTFAGIQGTIAFEEADQIIRFISKTLGAPMSLSEVVLSLSERIESAPHMLSHGMFSLFGIDLSKRLGLQSTVANSMAEAVFPGGSKPAAVIAHTWDLAWDPSELNMKRLASEIMPRPAATHFDQEWFSGKTSKGETFGINKDTLKPGPVRTDRDVTARKWGLQGIDESVAKQKKWDVDWKTQAYAEIRTKALKKMKEELFMDGEVSEMTKQKYMNAEGDFTTMTNQIMEMKQKMSVPGGRLELLRAAGSRSTTEQKRAQRLKEAVK